MPLARTLVTAVRNYHAVGRLQPYLRVRVIPILRDNYSYAIIDEANKDLLLVDPAEPEPIQRVLEEEEDMNGSELRALLTTHKHLDHTGGNDYFASRFPGIEIIGPQKEEKEIPAITRAVNDGDKINPGNTNINITVLGTGCHTAGHISYFIDGDSEQPPLLFPGDTLFVGGCGRFFEGDASDMYNALYNIIWNLPDNTVIYCGHEYTISNLKFARTIEPHNSSVREKLAWSESQRNLGKPTVGSTLKDEKLYNPFLRCKEQSILDVLGMTDPVKALNELRERKDTF